jgi:hypothetical protein
LVALVEQLSIVYNTSIEDSLDKFCNFLPSGLFRYTCQQAVEEYGPIIINGYKNKDLNLFIMQSSKLFFFASIRLYSKETPDVVCQAIQICRIDTQPECRLFPNPKVNFYFFFILFKNYLIFS